MEIAAFETLIGEAYALEAEIEAYEREVLKPKKAKLAQLEGQILQTLADNELTSFKSSHGTVVRSTRYTVRTPKTIEEKTAFFEWLNESKGREVYWTYVSVNSQSLNSFYKAEMEAAKEANDFDFKIPGIGEPEATPVLSKRKK